MDDAFGPNQSDQTNFAVRFFAYLHRYRKLLLAYWWIPVVTVAVGFGIQWMLIRRAPQLFMSTGRMIVNVKVSIPNANLYSEELTYFFGTQVELMRSDSVLNRVRLRLQSTGAFTDPGPVNIAVTLSPKTSIFNLTAEGANPTYTQYYLEATMEEYINLKKDLLSKASYVTKSSLQDEMDKMALDVDKSRDAILNYQASNSVIFLQQNGGNSAADYLAFLTRQLADHKTELQMLKTLTLDENLERQQGIFAQQSAQAKTAQSAPEPQQASQQPSSAGSNSGNTQGTPTTTPANSETAQQANNPQNTPSSLGEFETAYLQAKQQIVLLKAKRDHMSVYLRPKHPDMIAINEEIDTQEKLLEIDKGQSQEQLKNRQHILELEITDLESQIAEWKIKAIDTSQKLEDYAALKENQRRMQTIYDQMQATLQTLDADSGISQDSVSIFEPATASVPASRQVVKHMSMAGMIGLVLAIGLLLFLDRLDDRPATFSEMERLFNEPILGQIPFVKSKRKKGVPFLGWDDDRYRLVEAYRNLRSALVFKDSVQGHPKSIVITSAIPNDGKSMTAANLAITLARGEERVLLVDADLRCGVMHKHFSVPSSPGLAEVLAEQCSWSDAVVQTSIPNLYLLPAGTPQRHPGGLFVARSKKFLKEVVTGPYDYFLFDTAPIMATDDVSNLAPHVDGVIMIVRAEFTSGRIARSALGLLNLRKVKIIGLVFNAVRPHAGEYYYYRYSRYYTHNPTA